MKTFRILVADDHAIFRFGLCSLLGSHKDWEVCGEATDGRDAVAKCRVTKPDLVILDINMPKLNGVDAARQILKDNPAQRILVLTDVTSEQVIRVCLDAGVRGWVFKADGAADVTTAVEALQHYKCIFSPRVADMIMDGYLRRGHVAPAATEAPRLSPREREVVQLVAEGKTSKEIAVMLDMSAKTAETHRSNVMRKLDLHSIAGLVLYAIRNDIIYVQAPVALSLPQPGNRLANVAAQVLD